MTDATIYALGTPTPTRAHPGALAVVRLSGPRSGDALELLTRRPLPAPRRMALRSLLDPSTGEVFDKGLVVWFAAPNTETGEPMAELHLHGGRAVVGAALEAIAHLGFCRLAEPGEFTRRAFEHGKLDLTEAEGIADLVAAETAAQRRQALQQMDGALHRLYEDWRAKGLRALAHLEAAIDFPDEDLPEGLADEVRVAVTGLQKEISAHLEDRRGERLRDGLSIAIIGPPNAGKSSLLNLLARREAAIVSETAGTTRDVIEVHLDLGGWPVVLADTAGLRDSDDAIEQEGVRRARARADAADLRVLVLDASGDWRAGMKAIIDATERWDAARDIVVVNKTDLVPVDDPGIVPLSTRGGIGLPGLLVRLEASAEAAMQEGAGAPPLTRARHREALLDCQASLERALYAPEVALAAEDLRLAMRAIGRITGTVRIDELLDVIFRDFCIGK
ncbi:MAG: tRNA uridine-5-carboxymethylaminomethyl(34) synthesis GTPase MnmE [Reyranella sp.]|uniref:tRNA uridine-5-carboxymethylaminomethyl(34) synthesis GTPase MnmE n=1 Tax=Reyranella sp. TaxID=1929291 RepID=UPI00122276A6|nr:tRNA uridine-5-carboxymethylaminomethyl(34) synthesis GTPase MnmE [Reyranella sp.]TAJ86463.1 MAG: tRNA uridine-5-carboxymethylaminomethyl(34) synthesis GTPase MnmE [Reyranella sp.]TBR29297.1 MAG: tRNA uridine-5-carboxymethylaminomethyl(34) synthesis GTPase MnmE [Reyranella sp.]